MKVIKINVLIDVLKSVDDEDLDLQQLLGLFETYSEDVEG